MTTAWFLSKVVLLIVYLICIMLSCKYWNVQLWKVRDKAARLLLDPAKFNFKELLEVIDYRGVRDINSTDAKRLSYIVNASGLVSEEEKWQSKIITERSKKKEAINIISQDHLTEVIEDNTPGIWLLRINTDMQKNTYIDNLWDDVVSKLHMLGIMSGIIHCQSCPNMCKSNNWTTNNFVLLRTTISYNNWSRKKVYFPEQLTNTNSSSVLVWIRHHLNDHIDHFSTGNFSQLRDIIIQRSSIHVVLFSTLTVAPTFISSLAIKFTNRINFSMVIVRTMNKTTRDLFADELNITKLPTYLIFTPEKNFTYGKRDGEYYGYHCMHEFLTSLYPATDDIFAAIVIGINLICIFKLLIIDGTFLACLLKFAILFCKYNIAIVLLWFPLYNFFTSPLMHIFTEVSMMVMRYLMGTDFVAIIRHSTHLTHPGCLFTLLIESIIFASVIYHWIEAHEPQGVQQQSITAYNYLSISSYKRSLHAILTYRTDCHQYSREDIEEGIDLIIEHLAVPKLYLQPIVPMDYIKFLPTFTYNDKAQSCYQDHKEEESNLNPDSNELTRVKECNYDGCEQDHSCDDTRCAICLTDYADSDCLCRLPCSHVFHHSCIVQWLSIGVINTCKCPLCRWPAYRSYLPSCSNHNQASIENSYDWSN